jgi:hypothetical protein
MNLLSISNHQNINFDIKKSDVRDAVVYPQSNHLLSKMRIFQTYKIAGAICSSPLFFCLK